MVTFPSLALSIIRRIDDEIQPVFAEIRIVSDVLIEGERGVENIIKTSPTSCEEAGKGVRVDSMATFQIWLHRWIEPTAYNTASTAHTAAAPAQHL